MEQLKNNLSKISETISSKREHISTEATTIRSLIDPFLRALNYDPNDPAETVYEYDADSRLKKGDKVDIAILQNNKPIIFLECKKLGENLDKHVGQLNSYFVAVPEVDFGILTNGVEYRFYKESKEKSNTMELKPFLEFDLTKMISDSQLKTLFTFDKSNFDKDSLNSSIDLLATETAIKQFMNKIISQELNSDDEFISLLIKDTPFKNRRGENKERFAQLASKFLKSWVEDLVRERINHIAKQQSSEQIEEELAPAIITTLEEMEAYYIIKSICSEKISPAMVQYQDYQGFFSVYFDGKKTKHICKLYINDKKMEIEIHDQREKFDALEDLYHFKDQLFQKLEILK